MKSFRELGFRLNEIEGTRFARRGMDGKELDGFVPKDTTYDAWLRRQPRDFQEEVLGITKAKLFRGGLSIDKFVNDTGREYTIDELRRREMGL